MHCQIALDRLSLNQRTILAIPLKLMVTIPEVVKLYYPMVNLYSPSPKVCHLPAFQHMTGNHIAMWNPLNKTWNFQVFTAQATTVFPRTAKNIINLIRQEPLIIHPS
ncbi:hypothetical protein BY458DRAFT_525308 [Sporodiniella umbellata]|nr:hypothetical protein BY458DRAFT_525308 [Sporodiniella umbellata]